MEVYELPDSDPLLSQLILQAALIALNAVFACAEIAIISINDNKLDKMAASGDKRAKKLKSLTSQPARFLATIQIGITLAGYLGSAFAAGNFAGRLAAWLSGLVPKASLETLETFSIVLITLILSFFSLVVGELVPKRIAMQNAEKLGLALSGFIYLLSKAAAPVVWLLTKSTNGVLMLLQVDPHAQGDEISEEEIRMMVDVGSEKGAIDEDEKNFINNVFEFDDMTANEIMTHRTEVSMLWLEESDDEWRATITESRFSCYPICDESADDIFGVLYAKDYFRLKDRDRDTVLAKAVRPPQFVPESVHADVLFKNMKKSRNHFAIVLDEYGGMSGVVTMNDLLEQIVGDLEDDSSMPEDEPLIERLDSKTWRISGSAPLDMVSQNLSISLPDEEYATFAGMVLGILGTVPDDGQTPEIEEYGLAIKVTDIKEHRLENAVVAVLDKEPPPRARA
jgi:putative hemolysin